MQLLLLLSACFLASEAQILSPRIVNGHNATNIADFHYIISMYACPNGQRGCSKCGGSIIAPRFTVSAAHCFYNRLGVLYPLATTDIRVKAGSLLDIFRWENNPDAQEIRVVNYVVHPDYQRYKALRDNRQSSFDVCVMKLETPFNVAGQLVRPIPMAGSTYNPTGVGTVSGWGNIDVFNLVSTHRLKYAQSLILPQNECRSYGPMILGNMLCAFRFKEGFCGGDSGGPFVQTIGGVETLVGIVSFSPGWAKIYNITRDFCATAPDFYVSVAHFNTYITNAMTTL